MAAFPNIGEKYLFVFIFSCLVDFTGFPLITFQLWLLHTLKQ